MKRLQVLLPYTSGFNAADNPYSSEGFFKLCEDYGVSHNPMRYRNEKFFGTYKHGSWSDYIDPDSMTLGSLKNLSDLWMWGRTGYQRASGLMHT